MSAWIATIVIRHEGEFVHAYIADPGSIEQAILIGSIHASAAEMADVFEAWIDVMKRAVATKIGVDAPDWTREIVKDSDMSALVSRRLWLYENTPVCTCGESLQIQLRDVKAALWKCRTCKREWTYEPR